MINGPLRHALALSLSSILLGSCGSDSKEDFPSQVLFRVAGTGDPVQFELVSLNTGRSVYTLPAGRTFTVDSSTVTFLLANAAPPYEGTFQWLSGSGEVEISAIEVQGPVVIVQSGMLSEADPRISVQLECGGAPSVCDVARVPLPGPLTRFEVCAPVTPDDDCSNAISGRDFTGTVGDPRRSQVIGLIDPTEPGQAADTPAIIFLEDGQDTVSGIFRGTGDQTLRAELYVDDNLRSQSVDRQDVVVSDDI